MNFEELDWVPIFHHIVTFDNLNKKIVDGVKWMGRLRLVSSFLKDKVDSFLKGDNECYLDDFVDMALERRLNDSLEYLLGDCVHFFKGPSHAIERTLRGHRPLLTWISSPNKLTKGSTLNMMLTYCVENSLEESLIFLLNHKSVNLLSYRSLIDVVDQVREDESMVKLVINQPVYDEIFPYSNDPIENLNRMIMWKNQRRKPQVVFDWIVWFFGKDIHFSTEFFRAFKTVFPSEVSNILPSAFYKKIPLNSWQLIQNVWDLFKLEIADQWRESLIWITQYASNSKQIISLLDHLVEITEDNHVGEYSIPLIKKIKTDGSLWIASAILSSSIVHHLSSKSKEDLDQISMRSHDPSSFLIADCFLAIFEQLEMKEIHHSLLVSRKWFDLLGSEHFWRRKTLKRFFIGDLTNNIISCGAIETREMFSNQRRGINSSLFAGKMSFWRCLYTHFSMLITIDRIYVRDSPLLPTPIGSEHFMRRLCDRIVSR
eukprot:TRINITY_DN4664_c1_g1_i1.p1 TRINITY_DN4664_c1_g1~~TRINITY_DN4664_c1_g1_i1.p1  ORF type:complete len:486 (-),score=94.75 TRINITY_DN4664_c1_g1_i1:999-2456(-)